MLKLCATFCRSEMTAAGAGLILVVASFLAPPAEARHWRGHRHAWMQTHHEGRHHHEASFRYRHARASGAPSHIAAIVVDGNSGRTLYALNENDQRFPASITKVMTLYLLFEQLEKGRLRLDSEIHVSSYAAAQKPTKLGLRPGETIGVEDAIKAVVTRSANDIAVAIAESIGGDEGSFAQLMTAKAHALGMNDTHFANASGLPNGEQLTTAHDLAILGRAIQERFPRYYHYFSTHAFYYDGETIVNHNHLLDRVEGMDGIKTGYTRASGFNLLTSVHRDGRSLIAVVMGGRTAAARDRVVENLIEDHLAQCSAVRTATRIADASSSEDEATARPTEPARPRAIVVAANVPAYLPAARAQAGDGEGDSAENDDESGLRVAAVQTVTPTHAPGAAPAPPRPVAERSTAAVQLAEAAPPPKKASPAELGWRKGPDAVTPAVAAAGVTPPVKPKSEASERPAGKTPSDTTVAARSTDESDDDAPSVAKGWKIQIGATDDAAKASALLDKARQRDRSVLAAAKPVTEKVRKGDADYYRAQFAGLDSASAESACRSLKRSGFSCFATRD